MKTMKHYFPILLLLAGVGFTSTSEAALYQRLGGLAVYDSDFNITWLADANANGLMTWQTAKDWATGLNVGGYTGWRLPTTLQPDPSCYIQSGGYSVGYNCTGSELGHLFYIEGGLTQGQSITSSAYLAQFFTNMQNLFYYWSGTDYAPDPRHAWDFNTGIGSQFIASKVNNIYAWAVRSGDVGGGGSVPEPGVIGLMGIGALAWAGTRQKRRG